MASSVHSLGLFEHKGSGWRGLLGKGLQVIDRAYDARNRISTLTFPDGNGSQTWSYAADGLPTQVVTLANTNQKGTVTVDLSKVDSPKTGVQVIAQEDQHDIDTAERGRAAATSDEIRATERSAYGTEAVVAKGLGINISKGEQAKGGGFCCKLGSASAQDREGQMTMKSASLVPMLGLLLSAYASVGAAAVKDDPHEEVLCAITKNPGKYDRDEVVLSARYVTDNRHEEVLRNSRCSDGARILDIGKHGAASSVARFYAEQKRICLERNSPGLCNVSASVQVSGRIRLTQDRAVFDLEDVRHFAFDDER
ncbi:hypothetical protein AAHH21_13785 [Stenotrophomonas sp. BSUC-16]|jgi:hypothetical protein|uniref:hypothetical protein n=1 Tax=Stenotrophomonas sp. BSUC-16 TaxID=3156074 RepID=UPI000D4F3E60|nr:hypothetical protein C7E18_05200 [Stenotrophomonas maltophilia]